MELLKLATEWAKSEVFSTRFFIFFAIIFIIVSIGFWQLGKTDLAKAYIIPTLVAGLLLMTIGLGLFYTNKSRITQFEKAYNTDAASFFQSEIERSEGTLKEYKVVFKVIPILIIIAALLILFVNTPTWRAISITTIAMLTIILLVDGTAHSRIEVYHKKLKLMDTEKPFHKP
jgi:drug/metabolite transporter (DMT)-like permease